MTGKAVLRLIVLYLLPAVFCDAPSARETTRFGAAEDPELRLVIASAEDRTVGGTLRWEGATWELAGEWAAEDEIAGYGEHSTAALLFEIEIDDGVPWLTLTLIGDEDTLHEFRLVTEDGMAALRMPDGMPANAAGPGERVEPAPAVAGAVRNPALVGTWVRQDIVADGTMSLATQSLMVIGADGVLVTGPARAVASGAGFGGDTGMGGPVLRVYWRTEGELLQVSGAATGPWQPLARYRIADGKLLFTYYDGSRHLWHRR